MQRVTLLWTSLRVAVNLLVLQARSAVLGISV